MNQTTLQQGNRGPSWSSTWTSGQPLSLWNPQASNITISHNWWQISLSFCIRQPFIWNALSSISLQVNSYIVFKAVQMHLSDEVSLTSPGRLGPVFLMILGYFVQTLFWHWWCYNIALTHFFLQVVYEQFGLGHAFFIYTFPENTTVIILHFK